jgi:hypothetical protein
MKKLAHLILSLWTACGASQVQTRTQPLVKTVLTITYDPYHLRFESREGKFEHAELYEDSRRYLCFESLKPAKNPFQFGKGHVFYDFDNGPDCDGITDIISSDDMEIKRPLNPPESIFNSQFNIADNNLTRFKKDYRTDEIRREWLERKDRCQGTCYFEVERNLRKDNK